MPAASELVEPDRTECHVSTCGTLSQKADAATGMSLPMGLVEAVEEELRHIDYITKHIQAFTSSPISASKPMA